MNKKKECDLTKLIQDNSNILVNIYNYILNSFKITKVELLDNTRVYITDLFRNIKLLKYRELDLRNERRKLVDDLEDLKRAYVSGDNLSINEQGKNTGGKINQVELRQIKMLELQEELRQKLSDSLILEKSLKDHSEFFKGFIQLIQNPQHMEIVYRMYINCETASVIANEYCYSTGTVQEYRKRGISFLEKVLKCYLSKLQ